MEARCLLKQFSLCVSLGSSDFTTVGRQLPDGTISARLKLEFVLNFLENVYDYIFEALFFVLKRWRIPPAGSYQS